LLHRTASALITARELHAGTAVMLVHAFGCPDDRRQDFQRFVDAMHGEQAGVDVYAVSRRESPRLYLACCVGNPKYLSVNVPACMEYVAPQ